MKRNRARARLAALAAGLALLIAGGATLAAVEPSSASPAAVDDQAASPGEALRAKFAALRGALDESGFGRPLRLLSREGDDRVEGEVYALVAQPFATVEDGLHEAAQWCQVLVLPFNVKHCDARDGRLALYIARHKDSAPGDSYRLDFRFREQSRGADFMGIALRAPSGPFGTHDYRILFEATPADPGHTLLHLTYSYGYGWMSQFAMRMYLSTAGAENVGFTVESRDAQGKPVYVRGMRGVMERNTMRYFLAIEAYLDTLAAPAKGREDARLEAWFKGVERYPRQLHEMPLDRYLAMKRRDIAWDSASHRVAEGS